jgi:enoyl ACP reductase
VGGLVEGKRFLVTGILTQRSIAFHVARRLCAEGGEVVATGFGKGLRLTQRAVATLPTEVEVVELDVNDQRHLAALAERLADRPLHGLLHGVAFAPQEALGGRFLWTAPEAAELAFRTSAFSLKALVEAALPSLRAAGNASVVALSFETNRAWLGYDWMGVAKAALESVARYLACQLGPEGIRVNTVTAGPLQTPAASGIPGFEVLASRWQREAPLGWNPEDPSPVADAVLFLLSDLARAISGAILPVDGGFHALGGRLDAAADGRAAGQAPDPLPPAP